MCYTSVMEQENSNSNQQNKDTIVEQMEKINFSLSQIAGALSIFKALTIIILLIVILGAIIALALLSKSIHF